MREELGHNKPNRRLSLWRQFNPVFLRLRGHQHDILLQKNRQTRAQALNLQGREIFLLLEHNFQLFLKTSENLRV